MIQQESESAKHELESSKQIIAAKESELAEKNRRIANTQIVNKELLSYKLFLERNETLYVITSKIYSIQGAFKVGRSGSTGAKDRCTNMNTGHVPGDDLFIAMAFKTNDSKQLECRAHTLMQHHRIANSREWFHLPYPVICKIITMLNENHNAEQELMNEITQILHNISCASPEQIKWDEGIPLLITTTGNAAEHMDEIVRPGFTYCIRGWTIEQTYDFIVSVLTEYKNQPVNKKSSWTSISKYLTAKLKSHAKKPNIRSARADIVQLCQDIGIILA